MTDLSERTMTEAFEATADGRDGTAVRFEGVDHSYADLASAGRAFGDGLAALGHERGDPGAVWLPNRPAWFESYLGFAAVGAPVVTVNTRYRTYELAYMLEDSRATTLVLQASLLDREFLGMLREVCPAVDRVDPDELGDATDRPLERVVVCDRDGDADIPRGAYRYEAVLDRGRDAGALAADVSVAPTDPATVFYTSGTTSQPKGVVHDHVSTVIHPQVMADWLGVTAADTALGVVPVCGVAGFDFAWSTLLSGGMLRLQSHFDPEAAAAAIERDGVTYIAAVGEMYEAMLATDHDLTSLERGSAWLVDREDMATIEPRCGFPVSQPYGLSEGHSHLCLSPPDAPREERYAAGGPPLHEDIDIEIRDPETGDRLGPDEPGELYLRGYPRMVEYLHRPERTAAEVDGDGWLATGDLCEIDADGRLTYHSRLDDMLRLRGFRVTPGKIERAVEDHPRVARAQVVGVPRGDGEDVAVGFVRAAADTTADDLRAFLHDHVADYKVPARFEFVDAFPTTEGPNGEKIQRTELADRAGDLVDPDRGT